MAQSNSSLSERILTLGIIGIITWPKPLRLIDWVLSGMSYSISTLFRTVLKFLFKPKNSEINSVKISKHWISRDARLRHTHIVGATGTGKTVLLEKLLFQDLKNGLGALIIDPKGDRELYERVRAFAVTIGRGSDLHYLSAQHQSESASWNPCQLGSASNLQTKFYNANTYSEPHYAKACEKGLLVGFERLMRTKPNGFNLLDLVSEIEIASREEKEKTLEGLKYDLYNLAHSEWSSVLGLDAAGISPNSISLLEITKKNEILFVDLPTESSVIQSQRIGKLLLQEMMLISGLRKIRPEHQSEKPFSIYIDEFDAFANEPFVTFLNKARSSGFMIHLAHQTLSDLEKISPQFAGQIMGNTNVRFVFRQDDPDDAETWARFFGTKKIIKTTWQSKDGSKSGIESNRETQEFHIKPDTIKELRTGECVLSVKTDKILDTVRIDLPKTIKKPSFILDRTHQPGTRSPKLRQDPSRSPPTIEFTLSPDELIPNLNHKKKGKPL